MRLRAWVLLGIVTVAVLLLLAWAARMPAVCATAVPCSQDARVLPSVLGSIFVAALAVGTAALAHHSRGRVTEGVRRSDGIVAVGTAVIGAVGIVFVVLTLFSAGFALRI